MLNEELKNKLVEIACEQYKASVDFKKDRMAEIEKNYEFYNGRKIKVPRGRSAIPLPTLSGFVDTLMSKIDDPPNLKYSYVDLADLKLAQKTTAAFQIDSHPNKANYPLKDRWEKKLAIFSGRGTAKIYSESDPKYKHYYEVVDYQDLMTEPAGGGNLEEHLFKGQDNIFRTKTQLFNNARNGLYDSAAVRLLLQRIKDKDYKKNEEIYENKKSRWEKLGLKLTDNLYLGQPIYKFIEWVMEYEGDWYYLLFDIITKVAVRCQLLEEVFESKLSPWVSWATHEDPFIFWSKAPCDDVRPVADAIDILFNQAIDNRNKKNFGMRAYDPDIFPNPEELEWRPDGLVLSTPKGKQISQGIYEFQVGEVAGTIDLVALMKGYLARETGVTPEAQGAADAEKQKVGIYFGNLQQIADRLGLYNKSYREAWLAKGLRYAWGLKEHLNEPMLVKMIGEAGVEWDELTRGETKKSPDLDLEITGGQAEMAANESKAAKRERALDRLLKTKLFSFLNQNWVLQEILRGGQFEESDIKLAMSKENTNLELLSEASQSIQQILAGKKPKLNKGADTSFIQKIIDYATDNEVKMDVYMALMNYAKAHLKIAMQNMARKAWLITKMRPAPEEGRSELNITENMRVPEPRPGEPAGVPGAKATALLQGKGVEV